MNTSIYINPNLLNKIKERAVKESRSISNLISVLLTEALDNR
ncbi:MAG: hypothetical protein PSN04_03320 [Methyloprofundus sp.]|nr:hypothetical protein [Methyloprofundus sp.]